MSTENIAVEATPVESTNDDLDTFSAEFFGQKEAQPEQASPEEVVEEVSEDIDANEENTQHEDDTLDDDTDVDEQVEDTDLKTDKPRRNRAQERIEELNKKYRETERLLEIALTRLEQAPTKTPEAKAETVVETETAPSPFDQNEDGSDKYPLGEFDPQLIVDLTKHAANEQFKLWKDQVRQEQEQTQAKQTEQQEVVKLQNEWQDRIAPARERYPDFVEKGEELIQTFSDIDNTQYGEYLAKTIMSMDYGPDVLYYLSNNPDEARLIVDSGATKATITLGRIEAKFAGEAAEKEIARPRVSKAPAPPSSINRGSAQSMPDVEDDTDDLDAFANKFFKKRR